MTDAPIYSMTYMSCTLCTMYKMLFAIFNVKGMDIYIYPSP